MKDKGRGGTQPPLSSFSQLPEKEEGDDEGVDD